MEFTSRIECGLDRNYLTDGLNMGLVLYKWFRDNIHISERWRIERQKVKLRAIRSFPGEILYNTLGDLHRRIHSFSIKIIIKNSSYHHVIIIFFDKIQRSVVEETSTG